MNLQRPKTWASRLRNDNPTEVVRGPSGRRFYSRPVTCLIEIFVHVELIRVSETGREIWKNNLRNLTQKDKHKCVKDNFIVTTWNVRGIANKENN